MDLKLSILRLASDLAAHSAARQGIIAENVAHADTPGYRARDIEDFGGIVADRGLAFEARTTRPGHIGFGAEPRGYEPREMVAFGAETPNGNTVAIEDQMTRAAEVRQSHDLALGVYQKSMDILRSGIGRQR